MRTAPDNLCLVSGFRSEVFDHANSAQLSFVNDGDAVTKRFSVREDVRGQEDGLALIFQALNEFPHFTAPDWIQTRHWLVKKNKLRIMDNRLCDPHPLQHALGEFSQLLFSSVAQADAFQQLRKTLAPLALRHT